MNRCNCGCGAEVSGYNYNLKRPHEYLHGHNSKGKEFVPRNQIPCACGCGEYILNYKYGMPVKFKRYHQPKSNKHYHWKGGKAKHSQGYLMIRTEGHPRASKKGHYVLEHILEMEKYLGRYLKENEVVHHINRNRQDNRIENLQLTTTSKHQELHVQTRGKDGRFVKVVPGSL